MRQVVLQPSMWSRRDFVMLDRLMKWKPNTLDFVYEETLLFVRNKTDAWWVKLAEEEL